METENKSGIYCIENKTNGKKYIGQGIDVRKRMIAFHGNSVALLGAFEKYGKENFETYIIEFCEEKELEEKEMYWIKELKSHVSENGYNISWGGSSPMKNRTHSEETKEKIRLTKIGDKNPMFGTTGEKSPNYKKPKTEESKEKMSIAKKGKKLSEKHRKNIGLAVSKRIIKDSTREKLSVLNSGKNNASYGKKTKKNPSSKYLGVVKIKNGSYIYWRVSFDGKILGNYKDEIEAAKQHDKYITENKIDYPLNFPTDDV